MSMKIPRVKEFWINRFGGIHSNSETLGKKGLIVEIGEGKIGSKKAKEIEIKKEGGTMIELRDMSNPNLNGRTKIRRTDARGEASFNNSSRVLIGRLFRTRHVI